jgi:hypothetical protein
MRLTPWPSVPLLVLAAAACTGSPDRAPIASAELVAPVFAAAAAHATHLTGARERPNPVDTKAVGQLVIKDGGDGSISFRLIASNIQNVTQAHIHRITNPAGNGTGGIVVWLYPPAPPLQLIPGRSSGILAEGSFTAANFVGTLAGQSMDVLLAELAAGNLYVNVHTSANPPGEIRGDM